MEISPTPLSENSDSAIEGNDMNRFQRTKILLGDEGFEKLQKAHVAVFGLGGVGSYAAEALARAGVGELTIVDFDKVNPTNINRQNIALETTVGMQKSQAMAERIKLINPNCKLNVIDRFYEAANSDEIITTNFSAVIDAIDTFNSKIKLIVECKHKKIPIFSAMGAAGKIDPSQIKVGDISKTIVCPLAKKVRKTLKQMNIHKGIPVVYSLEDPKPAMSHTLFSKDENEFNPGLERMIMGSISYIPAIFGLTIAGMVINKLIKKEEL